MPSPVEYEKTSNIYFYLRDHAEANGDVPVSFRNMATALGYKSWSAARWHVLHLENAGLVNRAPRPSYKYKSIQIRNMDMDDPVAVYEILSMSPRPQWDKIKKKESG